MIRLIKWIFFLALAACAAFGWLYHEYHEFLTAPLALGGPERVIQIPKGTHAGGVVDILREAGIIESSWMMGYVLRESGLSERLQPGLVVLHEGMTAADIPDVLARVGKYARLTVQLLPGMNIYEMADRLHESRVADRVLFLEMVRDPVRTAELGVPAETLEGYLAAGAYTFEAGTPPERVVAQMHERWLDIWRSVIDENRGAYDAMTRHYNDHELVTLASMVEKEAVLEKEKPVIARVFYNRLRKDMKLQSDPTCVYPPLSPGERPSPARCKDPSNRYSTYMRAGLPPGPIAVPSRGSLRAVLRPYRGPDDRQLLYFVARQDGSHGHYFSKTYREHKIAVDYYLKNKKNRRPHGTVQPK